MVFESVLLNYITESETRLKVRNTLAKIGLR